MKLKTEGHLILNRKLHQKITKPKSKFSLILGYLIVNPAGFSYRLDGKGGGGCSRPPMNEEPASMVVLSFFFFHILITCLLTNYW